MVNPVTGRPKGAVPDGGSRSRVDGSGRVGYVSAMLDRPEGEESPYKSSISIPPSMLSLVPPLPKKNYWVEMALPGPEARKVAMDAALVIEGTIQALDGGKLSICKPNYIEAQIDAPTEIYGSECWVGANVSRIAFIRKSTGEVLKEWVK